MATTGEATKLDQFNEWLHVNGAHLRGCRIDRRGPSEGFGVFPSDTAADGVLMVVPLDLAITPMRVLQDPLLGPRCNEMYEHGDVDDRFLMMLFLTVERLRAGSHWKPYIDMLPSTFSTPVWFSEEELAELKGTPLYRATLLQKESLRAVFDCKVKSLVMEILQDDGALELNGEVDFQDFLWANSIFWTRALNIPFPHSYVFPPPLTQGEACSSHTNNGSGACITDVVVSTGQKQEPETSASPTAETVWAEGLVPGIDFCNHGLEAAATWEVDNTGSKTGVPSSMYLLSIQPSNSSAAKEILINYGDKGNEELLYLYGFVINNNPDDFLMVYYPMDALQSLPSAEFKAQLLAVQKADLRWLLPRGLLDHGSFSDNDRNKQQDPVNLEYSYSWSGHRKAPSYLNKLIFPENCMTSLRTIAMRENEIDQVSTLLQELVGSDAEKEPSDREVQAAIWEICGDSGALQMLVDLLQSKIMELEEGSGTEAHDSELLEKYLHMEGSKDHKSIHEDDVEVDIGGNKWSCIVYRRGQKELARLFLKEAEQALELCLKEQT